MAVTDTLRGFRTQFLYTIYRVVKDCDLAVYYVPEGVEDLDIKKNGRILETIQIKNHKSKINPSDLSSQAGTTSFFKRAVVTISENCNATVRLVSFGEIGSNLQTPQLLCKYLKKVKEKEIRQKAVILSSHYKAEKIEEDFLYDGIVGILKTKFPTFNPEKEIKYLLQWVYDKAERHIEFTYCDLINGLNCYRIFENRQEFALRELGNRIVPLFQDSLKLDVDVLKKGFYAGLSAKSEHILLNLDVQRPEKIEAIRSAFKEQNVVIVNGASGQGKSVLSYRYIKDNCALAYEINSCDHNSLANLKAALTEMCSGLSMPVLLYFDAKPADASWIDIIGTFCKVKNIQCLISLRNEDWNQYRSRLGSNVLYKDIELCLSKEEAFHIYKMLCPNNINYVADFEILWEKLGENVALLEFVYYITQGQALKDKLISQWESLSSFEKSILETVIIANYYGGKIYRCSDALCANSYFPDVQDIIDKYLGEFFMEDANGLLDAVHPLRTKIIAESIYRNNQKLMNKNALSLYFQSEMSDSHLYLLNLLRNGLSIDVLLNKTMRQYVLTGKQFAGIVRAIIWKGTEEYLSDVHPLIDQLKDKVGVLWEFYLPVNFTEINIKENLHDILKDLPNVPDVSEIVKSFPSQDKIFIYLKKILDNNLTIELQSNSDWVFVADSLYRISLCKYPSHIQLNGICDIKRLCTDDFSKILLGLKSIGLKKELWTEFEECFLEKLRFEYLITNLNIGENSIEVTSFMSYVGREEVLTQHKTDSSLNSHLVEIIDKLRMAFPEKENYHVFLGKDALSEIVVETEKNISKKNLPINAMCEIRSCIVNQYKNKVGITDRLDYVEKLISFRKEISNMNNILVNVFDKYWKTNEFDASKYLLAYKKVDSANNRIPQVSYLSSNVFGYGEIQNGEKNSTWHLFMKEMRNYATCLSSFYNQFLYVMTGKVNNIMPSVACLFDALLSVKSLQKKFRALFTSYITNIQEYKLLEESEYKNVLALWVFWDMQSRGIKNKSVGLQMDRFNNMKETFTKNIIDKIHNQFLIEGINSNVYILNKILYVDVLLVESEESGRINELIDSVLYGIIGNYNPFTTQELILKNDFETIQVHLFYVDSNGTKHRLSSLVRTYGLRQLLNYNMIDCKTCPISYIPDYDFVVDVKLADYEEVISLVTSLLLLGSQLLKMNESIEKNDVLGRQVVQKYKENLFSEFKNHKEAIERFKMSILEFTEMSYFYNLKNLICSLQSVLCLDFTKEKLIDLEKMLREILDFDYNIRISLINKNS